MKAKIVRCARNGKYFQGKEHVNSWSVVVVHKGTPKRVVLVNCWMGRSSSASVVYAGLWVYDRKFETSGHGSAGGGGYDKESAAVQGAIASAGIELYGAVHVNDEGKVLCHVGNRREWLPEDVTQRTSIDGVGESAIKAALLAIARAAGYRGQAVII